jgi:hypothetical protein
LQRQAHGAGDALFAGLTSTHAALRARSFENFHFRRPRNDIKGWLDLAPPFSFVSYFTLPLLDNQRQTRMPRPLQHNDTPLTTFHPSGELDPHRRSSLRSVVSSNSRHGIPAVPGRVRAILRHEKFPRLQDFKTSKLQDFKTSRIKTSSMNRNRQSSRAQATQSMSA